MTLNFDELIHEHKHKIESILGKKFKVDDIIKNDEKILLKRLHEYAHRHAVHSFHVASDCVYVAHKLELSPEDIEALRIAALIHDVGKLNMEIIVLVKGVDDKEVEAITRFIEKKYKRHIENPNLFNLTMKDLIEYRNEHLNFLDSKHINNEEKRVLIKRLGNQYNQPIMTHIRNHERWTKEILESRTSDREIKTLIERTHFTSRITDDIIALATTHHPEYRRGIHDYNIMIEILSAVDKFNAMIHSEGERKWTDALTRTEALNILVEKIKVNQKIAKALGTKYLVEEDFYLKTHMKNVINMLSEKRHVDLVLVRNLLKHGILFTKLNRKLHIVHDTSDIEKDIRYLAYQLGLTN